MVSNENLIHIRLEYGEAVEAKKDVLASEISLLKILKKIRAYREYKSKEFELKMDLYKKIKDL